MKLIPPIFEKVLSKEQVAANVSVARCDRADHWQIVKTIEGQSETIHTCLFLKETLQTQLYTSSSIEEKSYKA